MEMVWLLLIILGDLTSAGLHVYMETVEMPPLSGVLIPQFATFPPTWAFEFLYPALGNQRQVKSLPALKKLTVWFTYIFGGT